MQTPTKRRPLIALLVSLMLIATSLFSATAALADGGTLQDQYQAIRDAVAGLDTEHSEKAVKALDKGLEADNWATGDTLTRDGKRVFEGAAKAIKEMDKDGGNAALTGLLVDIATTLATAQISSAVAAGADADKIEKANKEMAKAAEKLADGDADDAIKKMLKAWKEAEKAERKALGGGSSGVGVEGAYAGSYSVYTVVYYNPTTLAFKTVTGTNAAGTPGFTGRGNEGYIFSPIFSPGDSFHGVDLMFEGVQGMQLHVSCSDAFAGGVGEKSDPTMDSKWLINTISITKFKDGVADKSCDLIGLGLPVPPGQEE